MKLSEFEGEQAIDVLADLLEPASEIMTDKAVVAAFRSGDRIHAVSLALKRHKKAVITILAVTEGENPETYKPKVLSLPAKLIEIGNDPDIIGLFQLQDQEGKTSSGPATESSGEEA